MPSQHRHRRPTAGVSAKIVVVGRRCIENIGQRGCSIGDVQSANGFNPSQLFHIGSHKRNRRRLKRTVGSGRALSSIAAAGDDAMRCQVFGDALGVPRWRVERTQRKRESVHALMQQQVATVGGAGLVHHPKAVSIAKTVGEVGDHSGQEASGSKAFAINDQTAKCLPLGMLGRIEIEVRAPLRKCLIK